MYDVVSKQGRSSVVEQRPLKPFWQPRQELPHSSSHAFSIRCETLNVPGDDALRQKLPIQVPPQQPPHLAVILCWTCVSSNQASAINSRKAKLGAESSWGAPPCAEACQESSLARQASSRGVFAPIPPRSTTRFRHHVSSSNPPNPQPLQKRE
jgi:hypothetical protein